MKTTKTATTVEEQIELLKSRHVVVEDEEKVKQILLDIGYYRLGSYLFPFEMTYPSKDNRNHMCYSGTNISDAIELYQFDDDLRYILNRYITKIEVNLRTYITYTVSNIYKSNPFWFADPNIMTEEYLSSFDTDIYNDTFKSNPVIAKHHTKYDEDSYAPAWKTIEHMTLGSLYKTFLGIKDTRIQREIANHYQVNKLTKFISYFSTIVTIRNQCAHWGVLFDMKLAKSIKNGPAGIFNSFTNSNIIGIIEVIKFFTRQISNNLVIELEDRVFKLIDSINSDIVCEKLEEISGFIIFEN